MSNPTVTTQPSGPAPTLIVGMPRAGSTWLIRALNCHPGIAAFGETSFWGRGFVQPDSDGNYHSMHLEEVAKALKSASYDTVVGRNEPGWLQNVTEPMLLNIIESSLKSLPAPVNPGEVFIALCKAIALAEGKAHWIEKTPHHIIWTDRIRRWLPGSRFVITLRGPFEFMLSYKYTRGVSAKDAQMLETMYHPVACAMVYKTYARVAMRLARELPSQVLLIRLEEVQEDPAGVIDRILQFFEYTPCPKGLVLPRPAYSSFGNGERPQLTSSERFWMAKIGGPSARALGYVVECPGFFGNSIYKPVLTFPLWAFRMIRMMSTRVKGGVLAYLWRWIFPRRG